MRLVDRLKRRPGGITPLDVAAVTGESDVNADLRAELPAAVEAALRRDYAPLRRLAEVAALDVPARPEQNSPGRFVAGACSEQAVPWDSATPPEQRLAEADRRAALLPADALFPFDRGLAVAGSRALLCLAWPVTPAPAADPGPLPDVPALLLQGDADLRTPLAGATAIVSAIRTATTI